MALEFDRNYYLFVNPDVQAAGIDAELHYNHNGAREGRDPNAYFDEVYYRESNPDVKSAINAGSLNSGFQHYMLYGKTEGRSPNEAFSESYYLSHNPDVAAAVTNGAFINGYEHFLAYGQRESRVSSASFSESTYLAANPDVAAAVAQGAVASGWSHFMNYGKFELHRDGVSGSLFSIPYGYSLYVGAEGDDYIIREGDKAVVFGESGKDEIIGTALSCTIHGGEGNDIIRTLRNDFEVYTGTLYGDAGKDLFVLEDLNSRHAENGSYIVGDFTQGEDAIKITGAYYFASDYRLLNHFPNGFSDVLNIVQNDANGNAVITYAETITVTLVGVGKEALTANDFLLPYSYTSIREFGVRELYHDEAFR